MLLFIYLKNVELLYYYKLVATSARYYYIGHRSLVILLLNICRGRTIHFRFIFIFRTLRYRCFLRLFTTRSSVSPFASHPTEIKEWTIFSSSKVSVFLSFSVNFRLASVNNRGYFWKKTYTYKCIIVRYNFKYKHDDRSVWYVITH